MGRQCHAVTSEGAALQHLHKVSRAGMVAAAGDSHSLAEIFMEILGALFPRRWCRAAWRHHLRAWATNLLGTGGDFRAC